MMQCMSSKLIFVLTILFFSFYSCTTTEGPTPVCEESYINVLAKANFGDEPLVLFQNYDYPQGYKIKFSRADFMVKGMKLSGSESNLSYKDSVFVLQFTATDLAKANEGIKLELDKCEGEFNELILGIGLNKEINAKKPSDFPSSDILSNSFYYWDAWKSYIFLKIEGKFDKDGDGIFEGSFVYHIGTDDLYRIINLPIDLKAQPGKSNTLTLNFDLKTILANGGDYIDIPANPSSHNPGDIAIAKKIADNLLVAVSTK